MTTYVDVVVDVSELQPAVDPAGTAKAIVHVAALDAVDGNRIAVSDVDGNTIYPDDHPPFRIGEGDAGSVTVRVPASDDPGLDPTGFVWRFAGRSSYGKFERQVEVLTSDAPQVQLSDKASAVSVDPSSTYVLQSIFDDHSARHEPGGSDALAVDAAAATGSLRTLGGGAQQAAPGTRGWVRLDDITADTEQAGLTLSEPTAGAWSAYDQFRVTCLNQSTANSLNRQALLRLNGDSGTNYTTAAHRVFTHNNSSAVRTVAAGSFAEVGTSPTRANIPDAAATNRVVISRGAGSWHIHSHGGGDFENGGVRHTEYWTGSGHWKSTADISQLLLSNSTGFTPVGFRVVLEAR